MSVANAIFKSEIHKNVFAAGNLPWTVLGSLQQTPQLDYSRAVFMAQVWNRSPLWTNVGLWAWTLTTQKPYVWLAWYETV